MAGGNTGNILWHQIVKSLDSRVVACYKTRNYPTVQHKHIGSCLTY